jgi:oxygen-dependent protoporphyrinogen oxidase
MVRRIEPPPTANGHWQIHCDGRDSWSADAVVLTCPAFQQAALVADFDGELASSMAAIPYAAVTVIALGYRQADVPRPLDGFGYLTPHLAARELLGVQWCSATFPDRAPAGMVLLRALCGGWRRPDIVHWDDKRLLAAVAGELRESLGIIANPVVHRIIRWDHAIPQYLLGHLERVAQIEAGVARHPGLFVGGNAYHGIALNDCTHQATILAQSVAADLRQRLGR